MPTFVVTGANRGLGLEFVTQLASQESNTIIATSRTLSPEKSGALETLKGKSPNFHILECDTGSVDSITSFASQVTTLLGPDGQIDCLINNAGINSVPQQTSLTLTAEGLHEHMAVNVFGPAKLVQVLQRHLKSGSKVMNMTSGLGSLTESKSKHVPQCMAYSISKAGLNMLTVHQCIELRDEGVVVICMDPGWVKTDMGGKGAMLEKAESIKGMLAVLRGLKVEDSGKFYLYDGTVKPW